MRKIPTLFQRDPDDRAHVLPVVHPDCQWVIDGKGTPTRKWDGTCTRLDDAGEWWARREVKPGKNPPAHYVAEEHDATTGKTVGWEPIAQSAFAKFHAEALTLENITRPGTYELLGPKINGNPDQFGQHVLVLHGWAPFSERNDFATAPRDYDGLREWLLARPQYEGIVWHFDGHMAKLKRRDFPA